MAPLFYYGLGGLSGALAYRLINTADSVLGYRDADREWLGKVPARLDDLANLIPARLTALLIILAAPFGRRSSVAGAAHLVARCAPNRQPQRRAPDERSRRCPGRRARETRCLPPGRRASAPRGRRHQPGHPLVVRNHRPGACSHRYTPAFPRERAMNHALARTPKGAQERHGRSDSHHRRRPLRQEPVCRTTCRRAWRRSGRLYRDGRGRSTMRCGRESPPTAPIGRLVAHPGGPRGRRCGHRGCCRESDAAPRYPRRLPDDAGQQSLARSRRRRGRDRLGARRSASEGDLRGLRPHRAERDRCHQ